MCSFQLLKCPFSMFMSTNEFNYFRNRSKRWRGTKIYGIIRLLMKTLTIPLCDREARKAGTKYLRICLQGTFFHAKNIHC